MRRGHVWFQKPKKRGKRRYERPKQRGGLAPVGNVLVPKASPWLLAACLISFVMLGWFSFSIATGTLPRSFFVKGTGLELGFIFLTLLFTSIYFPFRWNRDRKLHAAVEEIIFKSSDQINDAVLSFEKKKKGKLEPIAVEVEEEIS